MDLYEDNYYSDDEWNATIRDPEKCIVLRKGLGIEKIESTQEYKDFGKIENQPDIELVIIKAYEELQQYAKEYSIEILDQCSFYEFKEFLGKYIK